MTGIITPFAEIGAAVLAAGYSPIPIMPGNKAPAMWAAGEWRHMSGWSRFCEAPPSSFQVKLWSSWDGAGIGVACGRGLIAYDIDRDELVEPIRAVLPPAIVAKRGRKGETLFFRGDCDLIRSRGFKIDGFGVLDLISHGKQTVIPPSVHMVTGEPYVWTTERTLADTPIAALTEVTIEHHEAVIEVLKAFGYAPEPEITAGLGDGEGDSQTEFFRRLNEDALANLGAWVPRLGLTRLVRQGGGGFRSVAEWRPSNSGNPVHKRPLLLNIHPNGIMDHGDGDKPYTPLNVVMSAHGANLNQAAVWLGECLGYDFGSKVVLMSGIGRKITSSRHDATTLQRFDVKTAECVYRETSGGQVEPPAEIDPFADFNLPDRPALARPKPAPAAEPTSLNVDPEQAAEDDVLRSPDRLADLTHVPGLVGEIIDWIEASASYPSRELALGAALGWVGALAGRGFEAGDQGARTNLYMVGLAPSGFGKDHAGSCITMLAQKVGLDRFIGPARFMSASGLRETLMEQASILSIQDEFGGILRQIDGPKVGLHNEMIRYDLLQMFSRSKDFYAGAAYAAGRAVKLYNPNLCIYGMSTPDDFWSALSSGRNADGFLPRFLIFNVDGQKPERVKPRASRSSPPERLIETSRAIFQAVYGRGNLPASGSGSLSFPAKSVGFAPGAEDTINALDAVIARAEAATDSRFHPMIGRAREHAYKLALTVAVGADPAAPVISVEIAQWAAKLAWHCTCLLCREGSMRIADNDRQRSYLKVLDIIRRAGPDGITRGKIVDKLGGVLDKRTREELIEEAVASGRVISILHKPQVGRPSYRLISREFRPDA